jgi:hypothetical protein
LSSLNLDPLYLYTSRSVEYYCLRFLKTMLKPLLELAAHEFCPPKLLDDMVEASFIPGERYRSYPNFHFSNLTQVSHESLAIHPFYTALNFFPTGKSGYIASLKVLVPARIDHEFWRKSYPILSWDPGNEDIVAIEVNKWGYDLHASAKATAHQAENIICSIRVCIQSHSKILLLREPRLLDPEVELGKRPTWHPHANWLDTLPQESKCLILMGQKLSHSWRSAILDNDLQIMPTFGNAYEKVLSFMASFKLPLFIKCHYEAHFTRHTLC